jgi:hypothetical protein
MCAQGATASAILNSPRRKVGRPRKKVTACEACNLGKSDKVLA